MASTDASIPDEGATNYKQGLPRTDADLLAADAAAQFEVDLAHAAPPSVARPYSDIELERGRSSSEDIHAWQGKVERGLNPGELAGKLKHSKPPADTAPPARPGIFTEEDLAGNRLSHDLDDVPEDWSGTSEVRPGKVISNLEPVAPLVSTLRSSSRVPSANRSPLITVALALGIPLALGLGIYLGQSEGSGPMDAAGAVASKTPSQTGGIVGEASTVAPAACVAGASTAPSGGIDAGPTSDPGPVATELPTKKPPVPAKETPAPVKETSTPPKSTSEPITSKPPTGKIKLTPTAITASCAEGLPPFTLLLDNTSGPVDVAWSLEVGAGPAGPWATASALSGVVAAGQFKLVTVTPGDLCKVLKGTTTFELTVTLNGAPTIVTYEVSP